MNINELKYFIKVAEAKSLSKAANELFISYQGLSKSLKNLETELGCPLFEKNRFSAKLTEYGEELYRSAKLIVGEWENLQLSLGQIQRRKNKLFHIGIAMGVDIPFPDFHRRLDQFLTNHGDVIMIDAWDSYCEEKLESGELDIAVTFGPVDEQRFDSTRLLQGSLAAIVDDHHPLAERDTLSIADLQGQKIITVNRYFRNYDILMQACLAQGFKPDIVLNTVNLTATLIACQDKNTIGISNNLSYFKKTVVGYRIIPVAGPNTTCQINLLIHSKQRKNKEILRLKQELMRWLFVDSESLAKELR